MSANRPDTAEYGEARSPLGRIRHDIGIGASARQGHTPAMRGLGVSGRPIPFTRLAVVGARRTPLDVWILAFPGTQPLDVTGPHEVFAIANQFIDTGGPRQSLSDGAPAAGAC